ncbi:hypothetical protein [Mesorhizobium sp. M0203]|uniref:hypothetical protein n=1 Tax=Mesorhizobium sp. M0203 TaxID=2956912 RepID=UPI0033376BCC
MVPNSNARHFRIKAAQRDLIAAAGGIVRAAELCNFGKSTVGRWADIESPEWMDLTAADKLEAETGLNLFTLAWVESKGLKLADPGDGHARAVSLTSEVAGIAGALSTLLGEWAMASADGHATPAEADRLRKTVPTIREHLSRFENALSEVRAAGGLSLVAGRKVGGE